MTLKNELGETGNWSGPIRLQGWHAGGRLGDPEIGGNWESGLVAGGGD